MTDMITVSVKMREVLKIAETVAPSRASILIYGKSGTGKELLARYIHKMSQRVGRDFVAVNCAALPEGLLEAELFGYEKGAFTGAHQRRIGRFEMADHGTFLLDEISELPLLLQGKLLRVIQEGEVDRLGGTVPQQVDVRLIATSNKDLKLMVQKGEFREDLYYRLNVIPIRIPALRERVCDIRPLSQYFMQISSERSGATCVDITDSAYRKLEAHSWPGNVRELQNVIERSLLMAAGKPLTAEQVLIESSFDCPSGLTAARVDLRPGMTISEAERLLIMKTLELTQQNRTRAAELLGISIRTLRNKLHEYYSKGQYRSHFQEARS